MASSTRPTRPLSLIIRLLFLAFILRCSNATIPSIQRGKLEQVLDNTIDNPNNVGFYIYVPVELATTPAVIVAIHHCNGNATSYFSYSPYAKLADQRGYIVIYPSSVNSGSCWDVSSSRSLTHNGGGDSKTIVNFVLWTLEKFRGDPSRVFATGASSGAMMTNVLAAAYPDVFAAGTVYSGVGPGCFVSVVDQVNKWNASCADGKISASPEHWASVVRGMLPGGWNGTYPKMQIYHGSTDPTLAPQNYNETVKTWAGVFGYPYPAPKVEKDTPLPNYERSDFGPRLQGFYATGVGHNVPIRGADDLAFFGL